MESTKRSLLVAWDFSTVAEYALDHATIFAENVEAEVVLVHIVKKESQIEEAKDKMAEAVEKIYKEKIFDLNSLFVMEAYLLLLMM